MSVINIIRKRRSIRKYKFGVGIPKEHIKLLLECAMLAPSGQNSRLWEFVVLESEEAKKIAASLSPYARHIADASAAILVCGIEDDKKGEHFFPQNCGAAIENMLLAATELGYGTCWCGIYPRKKRTQKYIDAFSLKNIPVALIAIGIPDEEPEQRGFFDESKVKYI